MSIIQHSIKTVLGKDAEARFWAKVQKTETCWLWTASKNNTGYGTVHLGGRQKSAKTFVAHRLAYEMLCGRIEPGLTLDHLCKIRHCVNPEHLEPMTLHENILRGDGWAGRHARQVVCKWGHALRFRKQKKDGRYCYDCWLVSRRKWRQKKARARDANGNSC